MRSSNNDDFTSCTAWSRWPARKRGQVHLLQVFHLHALRRQSAQATFEAQIDLPVDERLGHFEIITLY